MEKFRSFQKEHMEGGTFTDKYGIIMLTAIDLLKVSVHIVSKPRYFQIQSTKLSKYYFSHDGDLPIAKYEYEGPGGPIALFRLGYYQVLLVYLHLS